MILSIFILIASVLLSSIIFFFPESTGLSTTATNSIQSLANYLYIFNNILAIDTLFSCLLIYLSFELILLGIQLIRWFIRFIPFFGSKI